MSHDPLDSPDPLTKGATTPIGGWSRAAQLKIEIGEGDVADAGQLLLCDPPLEVLCL